MPGRKEPLSAEEKGVVERLVLEARFDERSLGAALSEAGVAWADAWFSATISWLRRFSDGSRGWQEEAGTSPPVSWPPVPGDVWEDRHDLRWFATELMDLSTWCLVPELTARHKDIRSTESADVSWLLDRKPVLIVRSARRPR